MADETETTHELTLAQGELPNPLIIQVLDAETDEPIDLSTVDRVRFRMGAAHSGTVIDSYGRVADPEQGHIAYEWARSDLDGLQARLYEAAFRLRFEDRRTLIVPTADRLLVRVRETPFSAD